MTLETPPSTPVLIAGAGPAGLVLALTLSKNGIPVRIIDKAPAHHIGQRGAGIMPRTMEAYGLLGVLPDILDAALTVPPTRIYKLPGGQEVAKEFHMLPPLGATPAIPYPNGLLLGQDHLEGILRSHLAKYDCHVEIGTELRGFEQYPGHVTAHIGKTHNGAQIIDTVTCHWLIGTDGARGIVRKQLGLTFLGETRDADQHLVVADFQVKSGLDRKYIHQWGEMSHRFAFIRPTEHNNDVWTMIGGGRNVNHSKIVAERDEFLRFVHETTDRDDIEIGDIHWISEYRPNIRMVDKFGEGRVFVAGDAAHVHSPTGGQGMNTSVQDSFNLGWKLALVEKGLAAPSLLSTYTEERLPVIAEMLKMTTQILDRTIVAKTLDDSVWNRSGELLQLGVHYRWSSLIVDERPGAGENIAPRLPVAARGTLEGVLYAGDRAPEATNLRKVIGPDTVDGVTSLFRVFALSLHTVLFFAASNVEGLEDALKASKRYPADRIRTVSILRTHTTAPSVAGVDLVLMDEDGHAYTGYGVDGDKLTVIIVRPDGVVGAIVHGSEGILRYFERVFTTSAD
ncbi:monooxygenase [Obba rivulosa]|uniref:Monooxygenase n=1 Tax=Obba rivulosa TaxID=1052685 RepID=A0A8E2DLA1_9APHY|nr:monooxygenase [Obba rivulosa]